MRGFTPYLLLGFIVWVAIHNQLASFMKLATTINWNITPPAILADSTAATGSSALSVMGNLIKDAPAALMDHFVP